MTTCRSTCGISVPVEVAPQQRRALLSSNVRWRLTISSGSGISAQNWPSRMKTRYGRPFESMRRAVEPADEILRRGRLRHRAMVGSMPGRVLIGVAVAAGAGRRIFLVMLKLIGQSRTGNGNGESPDHMAYFARGANPCSATINANVNAAGGSRTPYRAAMQMVVIIAAIGKPRPHLRHREVTSQADAQASTDYSERSRLCAARRSIRDWTRKDVPPAGVFHIPSVRVECFRASMSRRSARPTTFRSWAARPPIAFPVRSRWCARTCLAFSSAGSKLLGGLKCEWHSRLSSRHFPQIELAD